MSAFAKSLRIVFLALAIQVPFLGIGIVTAADLPEAATNNEINPSLSSEKYLLLNADLLLLRTRFGAVLPEEIPELMHVAAQEVVTHGPSVEASEVLARDLTSEIYYYIVNMRYLIMADGAIWPSDRLARTYRLDALSMLDDIAYDLFLNGVFEVDLDQILNELEHVNAWTEGVESPVGNWFDAQQRQALVDAALSSVQGAITSSTS